MEKLRTNFNASKVDRQVFALLRSYFGDDKQANQFMRTFSGCVLRIPPAPALAHMTKDIQIYKSLLADPSAQNVRRLAGFYGVQVRDIAKIFARLNDGIRLTDYRESKGFKRSGIRKIEEDLAPLSA